MFYRPMSIRLIGLSVDNLVEKNSTQISLFDEKNFEKQEKIS